MPRARRLRGRPAGGQRRRRLPGPERQRLDRRLAAHANAGQPVAEAFLRNKVRTVEVGNNLYPSPWLARRYELPEAELARIFWEGVNVDYAGVQTRGEQVRAVLAAGSELHITNPNGTDLRVRVQGRPVFVSDGIISPEDVERGGGAINVFLPAGEVYVTPVAGTAEGRVVHTRDFYQGKEVQNLTMTFAAGKATGLTGTGEGFEKLKALYDAAGGDNSAPYGYQIFLPGSTVTLDGRVIIENGELKI